MFQANNKIQRWNDFYDRMSAKNDKSMKETFDHLTNYKLTHRKKIFTLNPEKLRKNTKAKGVKQNEIGHSNNMNEINMHGRYINATDENTQRNSRKSSNERRGSHFAWVD